MNQKVLGILSFLLLFTFPILWEDKDPDWYNGLILIAVFWVGWLIFRTQRAVPLSIPKVILPLSIYICLQALLLVSAPLPYLGYYIVLTNLGIMLIFLFFVDTLKVGWKPRTWETALIGIAVLLTIIEYAEILLRYYYWWNLTGSLTSFPMLGVRLDGIIFGHPNPTAGFYNLLIPLVFVRLLNQRSKLYRVVWGIILLLFLGIVFLTASRGGWVALMTGMIVTVLLIYGGKLISRIRKFDLNYRSLMKVRLSQWLLLIGVGFTSATLLTFGLRQINATAHGGRTEVWGNAVKMFMSSPLWGNGPNSFQFLDTLQSHSVAQEVFYPDAHNFWLHVAAETGIVGLAVMVWATYLIMRSYRTAWKKSVSDSSKLALAAYTGILAILVVNQLFDNFIDHAFYAISTILILALALSYAPSSEYFKLSRKRGGLIILVVLAGCILVAVISFTGTSKFSRGVEAARQGDWMLARENICEAFDQNPNNTFWGFQCGLTNAYIAYQTDDKQAIIEAVKFQRKSLAKDPYWYVHWANLASYEWEKGDYESAITHMKRAVNMAPKNSFLLINLGWMEEKSGNLEKATFAYRQALCLNPWYEDSIFIEQSFMRNEIHEEECRNEATLYHTYIENLLQGWNSLRALDYVSAESYFNQAIHLTTNNSIARASQGYLLEQTGKSAEAWINIQQALLLDSASYQTIQISAMVARDQGRKKEARDLLIKSLSLVWNTNLSKIFYITAYHYNYLPTDLSPFLIRPGINHEFMENYYWLEENYLKNNELTEYYQLNKFIERNILPKLD